MISYIVQNPKELFMLTLQHIYIVLIALIASIVIGLALGIFVARKGRMKMGKSVVAIMGFAESIPSIAFIALIFVYTGVGAKTAIIALAVYSIVPILFNVSSALLSVPEDIKEAATGMGMNDRAILLKIELPLSIKSIMAGIRTATTIDIATATVATVVGAGGLGEIIFIGIRALKPEMIAAGALLVSLLAIFSDIFLAYLQKKMVPKGLKIKLEEE